MQFSLRNLINKIVYFTVFSVITFLILLAAFFILRSPKQANIASQFPKKPLDIEVALKDFNYKSFKDDLVIEIQGKSLIRRGVKFLHVRSNVIKKNYLKEVVGRLKKGEREVYFSADEGEIDDKMILLKRNAKIKTQNKDIIMNSLKIDLEKGEIVDQNGQKMNFLHRG